MSAAFRGAKAGCHGCAGVSSAGATDDERLREDDRPGVDLGCAEVSTMARREEEAEGLLRV